MTPYEIEDVRYDGSMNQTSIYFIELAIYPLRVGADPKLVEVMRDDPMLFAAHYAAGGYLLRWSDDLTKIIERVRTRYEQYDEVLTLLEKLRGQVSGALTPDRARRLAEGLEVFNALRDALDTYAGMCRKRLASFGDLLAGISASDNPLTASGRVGWFCHLMQFSPTETALLTFAIAYTISPELQFLTKLFLEERFHRQAFWGRALEADAGSLKAALSSRGRLVGSGLLRAREGVPTISEFWVELLLKTETPIASEILEPFVPREATGGASRLVPKDREIVVSLLGSGKPGTNILLYGKPAVDKEHLALRLTQEAGCPAYGLTEDIPDGDLPAAVMVAQRLIGQDGQNVLVVEKSQDILTRSMPEAFAYFGLIEDEDDVGRSLDERILADTPVPTLWLASEAKRFQRDTLCRFLFHAEAMKGTRADRRAMVDAMIRELPVSEKHKAELVRLTGLSELQIASARTLAEITAGRSRKTFAENLLVAASRSQKALSRRDKDEARLPVTTYSLDYIHTAGRFGPEQILKALMRDPKGSLCLYGLPGTGKTQFAEHIAHELGKPILMKRASEIFDKYLGESEKRIAEAFDQAEEEGAMLLLDEADSFLRDRARSSHGWEVTTVNELLQRMERFEDIFICTTNLYQQVDTAALRRFTFKLEFLPLTIDQRWQMFLNEANLRGKGLSEKRQVTYEERLLFMKDLTPGDFATVKRQCLLLGEELAAEAWLDQLELEVKAKARPEHCDDRRELRAA